MVRGPVVVDTDVYSARLLPDSSLALRYEPFSSAASRSCPSRLSPNFTTAPSSEAGAPPDFDDWMRP